LNTGSFQKIERSEKRLYGPTAIIVCGYAPAEHSSIANALGKMDLDDRPVIFATQADLSRTLTQLLASANRHGKGQASPMARALVMSGFTQKEVHFLMSVYRKAQMPPQLWATLTPVSETWTLGALLDELAAEAAAFKKRRT
jgi:hypothetical protein